MRRILEKVCGGMDLNLLNKLQRRFGRFAIPELMKYIIITKAVVYVVEYLIPSVHLANYLTLDGSLVLKGQIWRLVTFIFVESKYSILTLILLYFSYIIGLALESAMGTFRFNVYYLVGMIGTIIIALATGGVVGIGYLNLSLILAYAYLFPEAKFLIFFIIPVKAKYIAGLSGAMLILSFILGGLISKLTIILSIINFLLFYGKEIILNLINKNKRHTIRRDNVIQMRRSIHKCKVCGITEKDDPYMDFRYCSKCYGDHEYCIEHLNNHEHIKE